MCIVLLILKMLLSFAKLLSFCYVLCLLRFPTSSMSDVVGVGCQPYVPRQPVPPIVKSGNLPQVPPALWVSTSDARNERLPSVQVQSESVGPDLPSEVGTKHRTQNTKHDLGQRGRTTCNRTGCSTPPRVNINMQSQRAPPHLITSATLTALQAPTPCCAWAWSLTPARSPRGSPGSWMQNTSMYRNNSSATNKI